MKATRIVLVVLASLVGAMILLIRGHRPEAVTTAPEPADQTASTSPAVPEPPRAAAVPPPSAPAPPPAVRRPRMTTPAGHPEASLMAELRALGASDPARALELARQGNRRFPNSPDAAERSWTICKSLAALGRFPEAQDEARRTVEQYPGTSWASDVRRHLLTQPLEDPAQRGYGRTSELD